MIDLSGLPLKKADPVLQEFGGILTPPLGGVRQRIDRAGTRWALDCETPQMEMEPDGREWSARIVSAKREGALIAIPQPDLVIGNPGNPAVSVTVQSGRLVPIAGMAPGYVLRAGQWVSFVRAGQRFADQVRAAVIADANGTAVIPIQYLLRRSLVAGDVVEVSKPMMEGSIVGDISWPNDTTGFTAFAFQIEEDE